MTQADRMLSMPPINTSVDPRRRFETLKDAEDTLREQGFRLVLDTCNWINDAGQIDAGVYPVGISKYWIEYRARDAIPSRRRFLTVSAIASVVGASSLAVAAMTPAIPAAVTIPRATVADPMFGLIEAHRRASAAHGIALEEQARLERLDDPLADSIGEQPCHDDYNAFNAVLAAAATTLPGILAQLAYLQEIADSDPWMFTDRQNAAIDLLEGFAGSVANVLAVTS